MVSFVCTRDANFSRQRHKSKAIVLFIRSLFRSLCKFSTAIPLSSDEFQAKIEFHSDLAVEENSKSTKSRLLFE